MFISVANTCLQSVYFTRKWYVSPNVKATSG